MKVKNQIFFSIIALVVILTFIFDYIFYKMEKVFSYKNFEESTINNSNIIDSTLKEFIETKKSDVEFLSEIVKVTYLSSDTLKIFKLYVENHENTTFAFFGSTNGKYLEYPIPSLSKDYDPRVRPWYLKAIDSDKVEVTDPYLTVASKELMISIVKVVESKSKKMGVCGIGVSLNNFKSVVNKIKLAYGGYLMILDERNRIVVDTKNNDGINLLDDISKVSKDFLTQNNFIMINDVKYYVLKKKSKYLNWTYITFVPEENILSRVYEMSKIATIIFVFFVVIAFFYSEFISIRITEPLVKLSKKIKMFGNKNFSVVFDRNKRGEFGEIENSLGFMSKSIKELLNQIEDKNEELKSYNQEILDVNKELENMYLKTEELNNVFEKLISIISKINSETDREDIFSEVLNLAVELIEEADTGSISLLTNDKWEFVATVGHDIDKLRRLNLKNDYMIKVSKVEIIKNLSNKNSKIMPKKIMKKFNEASIAIKEALIAPIFLGEKYVGNLSVEIVKDSDRVFEKNSKRIMKALSTISSSVLTSKNYAKIQGKMQSQIIYSLIKILEMYDPYTKGHSEFVARYSFEVAKKMGFDFEFCKKVYWAGLLHDIGKILIDKSILNKPGNLTDEEFNEIKKHPQIGYEILKTSEELGDIAKIVLYHHERYDGKGYPDGIFGTQIPIESRIICVVDTWNAMTSDRVYRKALSFEEAIKELKKNKNKQFDEEVVDVFIRKILGEFEENEDKK